MCICLFYLFYYFFVWFFHFQEGWRKNLNTRLLWYENWMHFSTFCNCDMANTFTIYVCMYTIVGRVIHNRSNKTVDHISMKFFYDSKRSFIRNVIAITYCLIFWLNFFHFSETVVLFDSYYSRVKIFLPSNIIADNNFAVPFWRFSSSQNWFYYPKNNGTG